MSSSSDLVRFVEFVLGVSLGDSITDSMIVIATTSLVVIIGILVFFWKNSSERRDVKPLVTPKPVSLKDDEDDDAVIAAGKIKVTIFDGTQTGTAEGFAKIEGIMKQLATPEAAVHPIPVRNILGDSYMNLLELQKAYFGALLSPQKSQYGVPLSAKSGSSNLHGYYGNSTFGGGMSYPRSSLGNTVIPNSPAGLGSPIRHTDMNMCFPYGTRNLAEGVTGSLTTYAGYNQDENFASSLLDEFKSNKAKCFELLEIAGHVVEFSADQYGNRFIQQKLETATNEEKNMFGNYVIQKFFEHGLPDQRRELAFKLFGHVLTLNLQIYSCRVIQKAIEVVALDQKIDILHELDGSIMRCV